MPTITSTRFRPVATDRAGSAEPRWPEPLCRAVRRTTFGANGALLDEAAGLGLDAWLSRELGADPNAPDAPTAQPTTDSPKAQREAAIQLAAWWLRRMVTSQHPLTERLVFGWHEYFATSIRTVRSPGLMLTQQSTLRHHAVGRFADLAPAMLVDPAILVWLDGRRNTRRSPNENLAREFFEMFTLGQGIAYTESDVRESARALTGWTITAAGTARFERARHDDGVKTVLGRTGRLGATDVAAAALARPECAAHVLRRWWRMLAAPTDAPAATTARLLGAYGERGELTPAFRALLTDPGFTAAAGTVVVSPVEWLVGALRALRVTLDDAALTAALAGLDRLGQVPFAPPNVSGWPAGHAWLTSASAQVRLDLAGWLTARGDLKAVENTPAAQRLSAATHLLGIPTLTARTVAAANAHATHPQRLVTTLLLSPEYLVQ